jgi:hypothetical protein
MRTSRTLLSGLVAFAVGGLGLAGQAAAALGAASAPAVSTGAAEGVGQSAAILTGTVDTRGYQTSYEFDLGADTGYGIRIFGNAGFEPGVQTFMAPLSDLMPGTLYHYRIVATNSLGTTYGADETFTTGTYPSAALSAPATEPLLPVPVLAPEPATGGAKVAPAASSTRTARVARAGHGTARQTAGRRGDGHGGHRRQRRGHRAARAGAERSRG